MRIARFPAICGNIATITHVYFTDAPCTATGYLEGKAAHSPVNLHAIERLRTPWSGPGNTG